MSNLAGGKFGVENTISNLQFGWVENLGWKMLYRISNLGCGLFGVENAISKFLIWGGWKILGGNAIESRIWGVENLGWKMLSRISNLGGGGILGGKCCLESRIWVGGKFGVDNVISTFLNWGGGGGGVENLGWKMLSRISNLGGWKIWGG